MKMHSLSACMVLLLVAHSICRAADDAPVDAVVTIDAANPGIQLSDTMWGLFFEEINFAGDGGIYAELVPTRDFEGRDPLESWSLAQNVSAERCRSTTNASRTKYVTNRCGLRLATCRRAAVCQWSILAIWGIPLRQGERLFLFSVCQS